MEPRDSYGAVGLMCYISVCFEFLSCVLCLRGCLSIALCRLISCLVLTGCTFGYEDQVFSYYCHNSHSLYMTLLSDIQIYFI